MTKKEVIEKYGEQWYNDRLAKHREWRKNNSNHIKEYNEKHRQKNKEYHKNYEQKRISTPLGRAKSLIRAYKSSDKKKGYGECTLTPEQLIGLWNKGCVYCGETDWHKLGADRLDNKKPHALENCVCSCWKCNDTKQRKAIKQPVMQYTKDGQFVAEYESAYDAYKQTGIYSTSIMYCCKNKPYFKTAGGYLWRFKTDIVYK